ncbi:MAG TPA: helix-hairpin-helix domain-containing protein [Gemmatimonadales bacterium]|nr:helix-hairpin-helix domain-containing protein [Gemmatimonadales bacterium]
MDKQAVRHTLEQLAAFLELKGESPVRIRAFRNAARAIAGYPADLAQAADSDALRRLKGVGPATADLVRELLHTGRCSALDELREHIPPGLVEMLRIPGLGVTKVRQVHEGLGIESLADLEAAAADGRLAALSHFGAKTAENVRKGIAYLRQSSDLRLFHHALDETEAVRRALEALEGVLRVEVAGAVRRRCELIRELALVAVHGGNGAGAALVQRLGVASGVTEIAGKTGAVTLRFTSGTVVDVFLATEAEFGLCWIRATGSPAHLEQLEARARTAGGSLDAGPALSDEEGVYRSLGLAWIPPELREDEGELQAAADGSLPRLIERRDLRGFLHCHSNYSDGTVTIAEWAAACRAEGYEWVGITDHSESAAYGGGLRAEDVVRQHAEIDAVNRDAGGIRVLKGVEADILADGTLDYGAEVLDRFEFVIGSIHSRFGMSEAEMTRRVLTAMDDPHLAILGHPTGRLLLQREPYAIDLEKVLAKAALRGIAVEVNADPHRLDLDWRAVRRARELGVTVSIGADAHSTGGITNGAVGVGIARKGWLEASQVLNTRDADAFLALARRRRRAG